MSKRELALSCDCIGTCAVALVTDWEQDDINEYGELFVQMYKHISCQRRWRDRLRIAWAVLRGRDPFTHGVMLQDPAKVEQLRDFLTGALNAYDARP